jgi:hypothetical protein
VHLLKEEKLAVIDIKNGNVAGTIPVQGSKVFFAANKTDLLLALPEKSVVERWSLDTLNKVDSKPLPGATVKAFALGANAKGPALIALADGVKDTNAVMLYWLDPATLTLSPVKTSGGQRPTLFRDQLHIRAAADGLLFGVWKTSVSPGGVGTILYAQPISQSFYAHESAGDVLPGATGKFLCTWSGLYNTEAKKLDAKLGLCLPALEGDYFLSFGSLGPKERQAKTLQAKVMAYAKDTPLGTVSIDNVDAGYSGGDFSFDKHVYFLPIAGYLVTLPRFTDRLVVQRLQSK